MASLKQTIEQETGGVIPTTAQAAAWDAKSIVENAKGGWNASTNTPDATATLVSVGDTLDVIVAGASSVTGSSIAYAVGDKLKRTQAGLVRIPAGSVPDGVVSRKKLDTELASLVAPLAIESGFVYAITDTNNKVVFGVRQDGTVWLNPTSNLIATSQLVNESVTYTKLAQDVKALYPAAVDTVSAGWAWALTDANGRIALGVRYDGSVYGYGLLSQSTLSISTQYLQDAAVTYTKLAQNVKDLVALTTNTVDTGWAWALTDAAGRIALGVRSDGTVYAQGINAGVADGGITYPKLDATLKTLLPWYGKKCLCIGDSVTAALGYQSTLADRTGMTVTTHAKPGISLVQMVDGDGAASAPIAALTAAQLQDMDVLTLFGGLNDRGSLVGTRNDLYPTQNTIYGKLNYVIQKLFSLAASINRKDIRIVLVAMHKVGKYSYIDADGGQEYPAGSGQTLENIANAIRDIGGLYGLPVVDLYHNSGINQYNWDIYTANTPGSGPFSANLDNVHPNAPGHARIGRFIATQINRL